MPTDERDPRPLARAAASLWSASSRLLGSDPVEQAARDAEARGYFRPAENELLAGWFARFLTVRGGLWEVIHEASAMVGSLRDFEDPDSWRGFAAGYCAACVIVRLDRYLVESLATDALTQRKLNEGSHEHRIPRKEYTAIFESLTLPDRAWQMLQGMNFARKHDAVVRGMADDPVVGALVEGWDELHSYLDPSKRSYLKRLWKFSEHAVRRAGASARQQLELDFFEQSGRMVSELRGRWADKRVTAPIRSQLRDLLRPGDAIVTRHDVAATNLFLPGFWPHAALFIGDESQRDTLGIRVDDDRRARWTGAACVLEALKDGVRFRPLEQTLGVDAVAVVRPRLSSAIIAEGIRRAVVHEGKHYNFDFDFFRSDRLVCTEVIYRAFDGLAGLEIPLPQRMGRPSLSAEDLLDFAIDDPSFEVVAVFGAPGCDDKLITGVEAGPALERSYRAGSP